MLFDQYICLSIIMRMTHRKLYVNLNCCTVSGLNELILQLCTAAFIVEVTQYIMIGELTNAQRDFTVTVTSTDDTGTLKSKKKIPSFKIDGLGFYEGTESMDDIPHLNDDDEDALLKDSTASFADWVTGFIRRVIILLENLPEEGVNGLSTGGTSEGTGPPHVLAEKFQLMCYVQHKSSMP